LSKEGYIDLQPEFRRINEQIHIKVSHLVQEDGLYSLSNQIDQKTISFNYDRQESKGKLWTKEDLYALVETNKDFKIWEENGLDLERSLSEDQKGTPFWHMLIISSLILMILESLLIKNWSKKQKNDPIK
jgi:hypothetical protein